MAFIQPCFIRKNTVELRNKLINIQQRRMYNWSFDYIYADYKCASSFVSFLASVKQSWVNTQGYIDCGTNEDLFLAIAALRDDTDMNQWFVTNKGEWFLSMYDSQYTHLCKRTIDGIDIGERTAHKATVQELIEHFK